MMVDQKVKLYRKGDQVFIATDLNEEIPVSIVWLRPATGIGGKISLLSAEKELMILEGLHEFDPESRIIAEEELERNYIIPKINKVLKADVYMGNIYFEVDTDKGSRRFVIKNPFTNIRHIEPDGMLVRDVMGNLFSIPSTSKLDVKSQSEMEKVF